LQAACAASLARSASASSPGSRTLQLFDYASVRFPPGPLRRQFEENRTLLLSLSEDSLLRPFRVREGLPAPGVDLGGWYGTYGFAPGANFGQWLSALARFHAVSGDDATKAKVGRLVRGLAATIKPAGKFYKDYRFPAYTYDKLVCGLIDAHRFANDPAALPTLGRATTAALPHLPPHAIPRHETPVRHHEDVTEHWWDESYTLPENLFLASQITHDANYSKLAERFIYHDFFNALASGENALPGKHAYSHVNCFSSAVQAFLNLGDRSYLAAAVNGFEMVRQQSYATGGWGPDEHFVVPGSGKLGESLRTTHSSFETPCGSYAHFKLTRYLLQITRDSKYGDSMERVLYNTILGARPIQVSGRSFYYSDYNRDGQKSWFPDEWPCCSGTLPQISADYHVSAYLRDTDALYVNLFVPSSLAWVSRGSKIGVRQTTDYPYDGQISFDFDLSSPATFSVFLRIPDWAAGARIALNGRPEPAPSTGTFARIRREWNAGDRIELELPLPLRLEPVDPQHPQTVALLRGPLVLCRLRDRSEQRLTRQDLLRVRPLSQKASSFKSSSAPVRFSAFADISDQPYSVYSDLST
jgi:DUF1680 family protein